MQFTPYRPASRVKWGIPVPEEAMELARKDVVNGGSDDDGETAAAALLATGKEDHMIYVWLDALSNYLTTTNAFADLDDTNNTNAFLSDGTSSASSSSSVSPRAMGMWPAHCQVVGKDILKFHAVYWYVLLLLVATLCFLRSRSGIVLIRTPQPSFQPVMHGVHTVSYTHLTLPTIYSV